MGNVKLYSFVGTPHLRKGAETAMTTTTDAGKTGRQIYTENVLRQLIRLDRAGDASEMALAVQAILETLGHYAQADRAFLFNLTEGGRAFRNSFEWCRSGVSAQQGNLQDIAPEEIPVWVETFSSGASIVIRDLEDVRETSPSEYALLKPQNVQREIASPIFYKGSLGGFLGLDNPGIEDTKFLVELLQLVGSHFGSSLENTRMVTVLKRSVEDLRREQQILSVLCEDYTAVYRADLLNDRASVVKMSRNSNIYEIQTRNRGEDLPYTAFLQEYCADYVVPEDRERVCDDMHRQFARGDTYSGRYRVQCRDGSRKWILDSGKRGVDEQGRSVLYGFFMDVDRYERSNQLYRQERRQYRDALQHNCEYTFCVDLTTGVLEREFVMKNGEIPYKWRDCRPLWTSIS